MISESTRKTYGRMISSLSTNGFNEQQIMKYPNDVWKYIDSLDLAFSSKKIYLSAVINLYKENNLETPVVFNDAMNSLKKMANTKAISQELTDVQKENTMTWSELLNVQKQYSKTVDKTSSVDYKDFLIVSLYTLNEPMRADYNDMKIYKKLPSDDTKGNYMIWTKSKKTFVFQDYKTSSKYGKIEIDINPALKKVIKHWLTLNNTEYLLGTPESSNWLTQRIILIMKRLTNKRVGINIFRHARITSELKGQKAITDKIPLAKNMAHSLQMQEQYLVK